MEDTQHRAAPPPGSGYVDAPVHSSVQQALTFNAISRALSEAGVFVPLNARVRAAHAVLAALHSGPPSWVQAPGELPHPAVEPDEFEGLVMMLIDFKKDGTSQGTSWAVDDPLLAAHLHHLSTHMGQPMHAATDDEVDEAMRAKYTAEAEPEQPQPVAVGPDGDLVRLYVDGELTGDELIERLCGRHGHAVPAEGATR